MSASATSSAKFAGINILNDLHNCLDRISETGSLQSILKIFKAIETKKVDHLSALFLSLESHSLKDKLTSIRTIDPKDKKILSSKIKTLNSLQFRTILNPSELTQFLSLTLDGKHVKHFENIMKIFNDRLLINKAKIEEFKGEGKTFIHFEPFSGLLHHEVDELLNPFIENNIPLIIDINTSKLRTKTIKKFIEKYSFYISVIEVQQIGSQFFEDFLSNCPNVQLIIIKTLDITTINIRNINKFNNLKLLYLSNLNNLENLSFLSPNTSLESIYIDNCPNLNTLLSIDFLKKLRTCKIQNCMSIDKTQLTPLIIDLFPHNSHVALQLLKFFLTDGKKFRYQDLAVIPANHYLDNLSLVIKKIFSRKPKDFSYSHIEPFLSHLHRYSFERFMLGKSAFSPLESIVPSEIFDEPHLLSRPFQLNKNQILQTAPQEEIIPLEPAHEIYLDQLLFLFDCINFTDSSKPGYIDSGSLKKDSTPVTYSKVRDGMVTLVETVKNRSFPFLGVPERLIKREKWYCQLELVLKNCVLAIDRYQNEDEEALLNVSRELILIAVSGLCCGTRMRDQAKESLLKLRNTPLLTVPQGEVKETIDRWTDQFKFETAKEVAFSLEFGYGNEYHTFGYVIKSLLKSDIKFSAKSLEKVDLQDPLIDTYENLSPEEVSHIYLEKVHPMSFLMAIKNHLIRTFENYPLFCSDCLDSLKVFTEQKILSSQEVEKAAALDPRMRHDYLKEKVIECGLMTENYDEETGNVSRSITLRGVLALLEIFGYISYPSAASSSSPVFSS